MIAADVNPDDGVAAVWTRRCGLWGRSAAHLDLYERIGQRWEWVGGGCDGSPPLGERSSFAGLDIVSTSGTHSFADRGRGSVPGPFTDVGWVSYTIFLAGSRVDALLAGDRRIAVPAHGYCVVAWKGPSADRPAAGRPRISAVGRDGTVLTEIGPRDRFDTAFVASLKEALRD